MLMCKRYVCDNLLYDTRKSVFSMNAISLVVKTCLNQSVCREEIQGVVLSLEDLFELTAIQ